MAFWKEQLAHEMREMNAEIEHLLQRKAVLEKMLFDSQRSLAISEECMLQREKRRGIDQTFDDPEKGLCKVRCTILLTKARFQFKRNRLRCVNENRKKRKRLRWQSANHGCHCFDRAFLLAGACVCCVNFTQQTSHACIVSKRLNLSSNCLHCLVTP